MGDCDQEPKRKKHKPIQPPSPSSDIDRKREKKTGSIGPSHRDSVFSRLGLPKDKKQNKPQEPRVCRNWSLRGTCDYGNTCCFSHPVHLASKANKKADSPSPQKRWSSPRPTKAPSPSRQDRVPIRRVTEVSPPPRLPTAKPSVKEGFRHYRNQNRSSSSNNEDKIGKRGSDSSGTPRKPASNDPPSYFAGERRLNSPRMTTTPRDNFGKGQGLRVVSPERIRQDSRAKEAGEKSRDAVAGDRIRCDKKFGDDFKQRDRKNGSDVELQDKGKRLDKDLPKAYAALRESSDDKFFLTKRLQAKEHDFELKKDRPYGKDSDDSFDKPTSSSASKERRDKKAVGSARSIEDREDDASRLRSQVIISRNATNSGKSKDRPDIKRDDSYDKRSGRLSPDTSPVRRTRPRDQSETPSSVKYDSKSARELERQRDEIKKSLQMLDRRKRERSKERDLPVDRPSRERKIAASNTGNNSMNKNRTLSYRRDNFNQNNNRLPARNRNDSANNAGSRNRDRFNWRSSVNNSNNNNNTSAKDRRPGPVGNLPKFPVKTDHGRFQPRNSLKNRPVASARYQQQAVQKRRVNRLMIRRPTGGGSGGGGVLTSSNTVPIGTRRPPLFKKANLNRNYRRQDNAEKAPKFESRKFVRDDRRTPRSSLNTSSDSQKDQPPRKKLRLEKDKGQKQRASSPKERSSEDRKSSVNKDDKKLSSSKQQQKKHDENKKVSSVDDEKSGGADQPPGKAVDKTTARRSSKEKSRSFSDTEKKRQDGEEDGKKSDLKSSKSRRNDDERPERRSKREKSTSSKEVHRPAAAADDEKDSPDAEKKSSAEPISSAAASDQDDKPPTTAAAALAVVDDDDDDHHEIISPAEQVLEPISDEETQDEAPTPVTIENLRVDWSILVKEKHELSQTLSVDHQLDNSVKEDKPPAVQSEPCPTVQADERQTEDRSTVVRPSALERFKLENILRRLPLDPNLLGPKLTGQLESIVNEEKKDKNNSCWKIDDKTPFKNLNCSTLSIVRNVGPYRKALSARFELGMRRKLCGLYEEPPQHLLMNASEVGVPFNGEIYAAVKNLFNKSREVAA